ncbi:8-oxo-dGTP pyrophosphatase MutT, NUDIX family [Tissierella praeacuta DSM 18095]|uniref:8-oxo-dGTP pyrophosphatase MutT, NUDIX family n=1 Tax=Tissierella praeacuta DSM 18095 TaxID=1123404 RepID=A0A1M4U957_9FIRM|nr:NUDIX domain-containing protein [Tissierella praeacuta]SHE53255.1 8-oxo-dGTP pyrophosphatase MutT, NUDIX family [Tissierella praeacuta DSM 18095]SUP04099.1 NUDIX domain [Tissierella praeacuta]
MELFAKLGVAGIIEKNVDGIDYILTQDRCKDEAILEYGLLQIPAGKIREFENVFDCLRREIWEETGLKVTNIKGENEVIVFESNGYKVLNYTPFSCSQNIQGKYPIMVQTFICRADGELLNKSNETKNIRWISLIELKELLEGDKSLFYPMHVSTLEKYLKMKLKY